MAWLREINFGLYAVLALLAWIAARRDRSHRAVAGYLTWMVAVDVLLRLLLRMRDGAPKPYTGTARLLFHVDEAIILAVSALFVALCIHYFVRRSTWPAFVGWGVAMAVCLDYPAVSKEALATVYRTVALITLLASWGCIAWGIARRKAVEPRVAHLILILYATTDVAIYLVPFTRGLSTNWPLVRLANFLLLTCSVAVHVWWLRRRPETAEAPA